MTLTAVATRYASALADVVMASASSVRPQDAAADLRSFESVLDGSVELYNALITPAVPASRKKAVVGRIADQLKLARIPRNLLFVLVDHRRVGLLAAIIQTFERIVDERMGYARALVTSADELNETQRNTVNAQLESLTGKRIRTRWSVDGALIGGVMARIGSTVYDGSVRGQLETLRHRLSAEN